MSNALKTMRQGEGFTLVEVLMAMIILLVGLLAVGSMQIMAMRGNQHARESTDRTTAADNIMEWLVSQDFNSNNLRITKPVANAETDQHSLAIDSSGTYTLDDGDTSDGEDDAAPPPDLIPPPDQSRKRITSISWDVTIQTWIDDDADGAYDSGEEVKSKRIDVTVNWEGGGSTQLSNIKPSME